MTGSGLGHMIEPIAVAAGSSSGFVSMSEEVFSGNNRVVAEEGSIRVRQTTIDALVRERNLTRLDFIKIDVEGGEPDVVLGARDTISRYKPAIMFESWRGEDPVANRATFDALADIGRYEFLVVDVDLPTVDAVRNAVSVRTPEAGDVVPCLGMVREITPAERDQWPDRINVLATPLGSDFIARLRARDM